MGRYKGLFKLETADDIAFFCFLGMIACLILDFVFDFFGWI